MLAMLIIQHLVRICTQIARGSGIGYIAFCLAHKMVGFLLIVVVVVIVAALHKERFDLKSSNFTRTFTPVGSITTPDMTLLSTFGRKLSQKKPSKMPPQTAASGISGEGFKRRSPNFTL